MSLTLHSDTPPEILDESLPAATFSMPYFHQMTGNLEGLRWSASGLPLGLTMEAGGVITGVPLEGGPHAVVVMAEDVCGRLAALVAKTLGMFVFPDATTTPAPTTTTAAPTTTTAAPTTTTTTPAPSGTLKFDFGTPSSPLAAGHVRVTHTDMYTSALGYGFIPGGGPLDSRDQGADVGSNEEHVRLPGDDLTRDFVFSRDMTFRVDVPNGTHTVKLVTGDFYSSQVNVQIFVQGVLRDTFTTTSGHTLTKYFTAAVTDGVLLVRMLGTDINIQNAILNGLEIDGEYVAPNPVVGSHLFDFGPQTTPAAAGHVKVTDKSYFNSHVGWGWTTHRGLPSARDRGAPEAPLNDFVFNRDFEFLVLVPPGAYTLTFKACDRDSPHDFNLYVQGVLRDSVTITNSSPPYVGVYSADAPSGEIRVRLNGTEFVPANENAIFSALYVEPAGATTTTTPAPTTTTTTTPAPATTTTTTPAPTTTTAPPPTPSGTPPPAPAATLDYGHGDVGPDWGAGANLTAVTSGLWSNPATWGGRLPVIGDSVLIPSGKTVTLDIMTAAAGILTIDPGAGLVYAPNLNVKLTVGTLFARAASTLTMLRDSGVRHETVIADWPDFTNDPNRWGHGLIIDGAVTTGGQFRVPGAHCVGEVPVGAATLTFTAAPLGWKVNDLLAIPDSRYRKNPEPWDAAFVSETETRRIASISADGRTVTLDSPLTYAHPGARDKDGYLTFTPWVLNVTREFVIRSENPGGTRGHIAFLHNAVVEWQDVGVEDMGRTTVDPFDAINIKGRYPIHPHRTHEPPVIVGCSVYGTDPLRNRSRGGIVLHGVHSSTVTDNAGFALGGAFIVEEEGNETSNLIERNIGSTVHGRRASIESPFGDPSVDGWYEGAVYWLRAGGSIFRDNVACDTLHGFVYHRGGLPHSMTRPLPGGGFETFDPYTVPHDFYNNEACGGRMSMGLTDWQYGWQSGPMPSALRTYIYDLKVWNVVKQGYFNYTTTRMTFIRPVMRFGGQGFYSSDYPQWQMEIHEADVQGFYSGIIFSPFGDQTVYGGIWKNQVGAKVRTRHTGNSEDPLNPTPRTIRLVNSLLEEWILDGGLEHYLVKCETAHGEHGVYITPLTQISIEGMNENPSDVFRVFFNEQLGSYIPPQIGGNIADGQPAVPGNLTNSEWLASAGKCYHGEVAPASAHSRPGFLGLVSP
jgi:fibronectin type 3 domain-containing protein